MSHKFHSSHFKTILTTIVISLLAIIPSLFVSGCKKNSNTETSYQAQVNVVHNHVLNQHNIAHLIMTYFKAVKNENLITQGNELIDGGYLYLSNNSTNGIDIRFNHGEGLYDPYLRLRAGEIVAKTDGDPFTIGTKTTFTFQNFSFRAVDTFPENAVTAQNILLEVTNASSDTYTFLLSIGNFTFSDTTSTKTVNLSGEMQIEWLKSADSPYFANSEIIRFLPVTSQTNHDGNVSEITGESIMQFETACGIFKGGSAALVIDGMSPGEGAISYETGQYCNTGANMTLGELPFRVGITDWQLK